ncbi:MAG: GNAT family N-acetyltransferase [Rhizobiales bacterium]|nr:GNAT family N-acetyltransferase [Hyphomicrobiales bacterium]
MSATLVTDRLLLRPIVSADAPAFVKYLNNYEITKYTAVIPHPYGAADAEAFVRLAAEAAANGSRHDFAIALKAGPDEATGVITLSIKSNATGWVLGYWLGQPFWGRRFMSEAADAVVAHAFKALGIEKLAASYQLGNEASRRILEGQGFANAQPETGFSLAQGKDVPLIRLELDFDSYVNAKERGQ